MSALHNPNFLLLLLLVLPYRNRWTCCSTATHQPASSVQPSVVTSEMVDVVNSNANEVRILKEGDYVRIVKGTFVNLCSDH